MAVTVNHLTTSTTDASQNSYTTGSISPGASRLVLLSVSTAIVGTPNTPTVSGAGMTWTQVGTSNTTNSRLTLFRALSASPGSGALTIDLAGQTNLRAHWSIVEFIGVDTGGTNGADAVVQAVFNSNTGTTTGLTVTLSAFGSSSNATFGVIRRNNTNDFTNDGGYTQLGDSSGGGRIRSMWRNDNDTSVAWTWGSEGVTSIAAGVEIKAAPSSGAFFQLF